VLGLDLQGGSSLLLEVDTGAVRKERLQGIADDVLRILRGAGDTGLRCSEIGERLVSSDPDITRLLGRLQKQKLIKRKRDPKDKRVIYATITAEGQRLLKEMDPIVSEGIRHILKQMSKEKLTTLVALLEEVREQLSA